MADSNLNFNLDYEPLQLSKQKQLDIYTFELLQCPAHPGYGVEVFCPKESQEPCLLCVKCILDPIISKEIKGARLIAIRDIIFKSIETTMSGAETHYSASDSSENLKQKYLDFNSKGYLELFERHVDHQMEKLDKELDRMRGSIQKLRGQFMDFFDKQVDYLRKQNNQIAALVTNHIEEKNEMEKVTFNSLDALLNELSSLGTFQEYQKFVRLLFKKSAYAENNGNDALINKIASVMERMRLQVSAMKKMKVDTRIIEDLRERIESINLLDKSLTMTDLACLDPGLEGTLEKLRRKDRKPESLEATRSTYPGYLGTSKKNSPADGLIKRKLSTLDDILNPKFGYERGEPSMLKTPASLKKYLQNGLGSDSHSKKHSSKDFYNPLFGSEAVVNLHNLIDSTYNPITNSFWYDPKVGNSSGKRGFERRKARDINSFSLGDGGNSMGYRASYLEELKKERESNSKIFERANDSFSIYEGSLRGANKIYQALDSLQEHSKNARISSHAYDTLIDDWVDDKLTGFVVFQNTLKDSLTDHSNENITNAEDAWLQLSRPERDEYIAIALMGRARIKDELKKQNIPDLFQLQELINQKITEVKK